VTFVEGLGLNKLVAASAVCLVVGVAAPAYAHPAAPSKNHAKVSLSPHKNVKPGTKITLTGTKGLKRTGYSCLLVILHHNTAGQGTANLISIVKTNSNNKGAFKCKVSYKPFSGFDAGKTVYCPPTKAEAKQGYSCAVAYFDSATSGKKSAGYAKFTAKK
jgi:hypothetical protein